MEEGSSWAALRVDKEGRGIEMTSPFFVGVWGALAFPESGSLMPSLWELAKVWIYPYL